MSKFFLASSALIGTIIGAGFLGIPYVAKQAGLGITLFVMLMVFGIIVITKLYFGEVVLRTKSIHQESGYAERYLGKKGKILMFLSMIFGIYAAILAYLIAESQSISYILFGSVADQFYIGVFFWIALSIFVYFGINSLKKGESIGVILIYILVISIVVLFYNKIDSSNLTYNNFSNFFVPFGVIFFAFLGYSAIPEVRRIIGEEGKIMKKTIWFANIIALLCYAAFTIVVVGFMGQSTPQIATLSLGKPFILLGMITMFTSYLSLSVALMDTFVFDFHISKFKSWLYTIIPPFILFSILEFYNNADFVKILDVGGILSGGLAAILILFMVKKAKKLGDRTPEYEIPYSPLLTFILIVIFISAMILEIIRLFT